MRYAPFNCAKFSLFSALSQSRNPAVVCQMASIKTKGQQARQYGLLSRLVRTVACPLGRLPPCCLASILDSDPIGCLLPTSPHTPHSAPLSRLIGEAEELSAADNSSPHRSFVGLGFSSRAFPFSTKNGMSRLKLTSCCLGMLFPSSRYVLFRFHRMSR